MDCPAEEACEIVRRFQDLASSCDHAARFRVGSNFDHGTFETRLQAGCCFEAAHLVVGSELGYMLSRSKEGLVVATVMLPNWHEEVTFSASCEANAMVGAVSAALWQATDSRFA